MLEIRYYNDWVDGANIRLCTFTLHNCGNCSGMDLFLLGFGIAFRV